MTIGSQISDMTVEATLPDGGFVPFVVTSPIAGLSVLENYRYNLGADLLTRVSYLALAANDAASLIGTASGDTVQEALDGKASLDDLAASTGSGLIGFKYDSPDAVATTVASVLLHSPVNLKEFAGLADGSSFTDAYVAAIAAGYRDIYLPAGTYCFDAMNDGTGAELVSGVRIFGDGAKTIIRRSLYNPQYACFMADSGAADAFIDDISFENLMFDGDIESLGHNETYGHFLALSGVRRLTINKVYFRGPRGDAVMLGSGAGGPTERHNQDVKITGCTFDGVLSGVVGGRNAISVIDGDDVYIAGCTFRNWSQFDMPGPICLEPNALPGPVINPFGIIKNIIIDGCTFINSGGNRGHVAISLDNIPFENWQNILVTNCTMNGNTGVCIYTRSGLPFPTTRQNIQISGCTMEGGDWFINKAIGHLNGLIVANNQTATRSNFGEGTGTYFLKKARFSGNQYSASSNANVVMTDSLEDVTFDGEDFGGTITQAHMIIGVGGGSTSALRVIDSVFRGTPSNGALQFGAGTANSLTNTWRGNGMGGMTHSLPAGDCDFVGTGGNYSDYLPATTPQTFPYGVSSTVWVSQAEPVAASTGLVTTSRYHSGNIVRMKQTFTSTAGAEYVRTPATTTTWNAWRAFTLTP